MVDIKKLEQQYETLAEVANRTGLEYHTILARLRRDAESGKPTYKALNTKWGWMVHKDTFRD